VNEIINFIHEENYTMDFDCCKLELGKNVYVTIIDKKSLDYDNCDNHARIIKYK